MQNLLQSFIIISQNDPFSTNALKPWESLKHCSILSVLNILYHLHREHSSELKKIITASPSTNLLLSIQRLFSKDIALEDFISQNLFLNPCDFFFKLRQDFEDSDYVSITEIDLKENPSISYVNVNEDKTCLFFELPQLPIYENVELYSFVSQGLDTGHELCGIVFKKQNYYLSLVLTYKGWVLFRNSGKQCFTNWAEGCAAAYEMGMTLYALVYVKRLVSLSSPENLREVNSVMRDFQDFYQALSTVKD